MAAALMQAGAWTVVRGSTLVSSPITVSTLMARRANESFLGAS